MVTVLAMLGLGGSTMDSVKLTITSQEDSKCRISLEEIAQIML